MNHLVFKKTVNLMTKKGSNKQEIGFFHVINHIILGSFLDSVLSLIPGWEVLVLGCEPICCAAVRFLNAHARIFTVDLEHHCLHACLLLYMRKFKVKKRYVSLHFIFVDWLLIYITEYIVA